MIDLFYRKTALLEKNSYFPHTHTAVTHSPYLHDTPMCENATRQNSSFSSERKTF